VAGPTDTPIYDRAKLSAGQKVAGPAIIDQFDSTTVLHPGDELTVDSALNMLIQVSE